MQINKYFIIMGLIVAILFAIILEPFSFIIWTVFFVLGNYIGKKLFATLPTRIDFSLVYGFVSIIGLIICIDNLYNFDSLTGFALDDGRFLKASKYLVGQAEKPQLEVSLFSYVLLVIAFPVSFIKEVALSDLLPLNWMLASLIAILLDKLSYFLTKRNIPLLLLLISYPLQYIMTDTITRLYRDNLLLFLYVSTFISIFQKKYFPSLLSMFPIVFLRGANVISFAILIMFKNFNRFQKLFIPVFILGAALTINNLPSIIKTAVIYGSDYSRTSRYNEAFSKLSTEEIMESRYNNATTTGNALRQKAYSSTSVTSIGIRAVFNYFFPLSLKNPASEMYHAERGNIEGFYIYYIINWFNILALVITTPLLVLGIFKSKGTELYLLSMLYLSFLLLVLLISGQTRHSCGAYIFNTIFIANGYYLSKQKKIIKQMSTLSSFVLFVFIIGYNLF